MRSLSSVTRFWCWWFSQETFQGYLQACQAELFALLHMTIGVLHGLVYLAEQGLFHGYAARAVPACRGAGVAPGDLGQATHGHWPAGSKNNAAQRPGPRSRGPGPRRQ